MDDARACAAARAPSALETLLAARRLRASSRKPQKKADAHQSIGLSLFWAHRIWRPATRKKVSTRWCERAPRLGTRPLRALSVSVARGRYQSGRHVLRAMLAMKLTTARIRKMKNSTFAIPTAPAAIPPKPNTAAISAMMKNTTA